MFSVLEVTGWTKVARAHRDQLASLASATPIALAVYAANVAIVVMTFQGVIPGFELAIWAASAFAICAAIAIRSVLRRRRKRRQPGVAHLTPFRNAAPAYVFAMLLGLPWAVLAARWAGVVHGDEELMLMALAVGMAAGGSILLAPLPAAAKIYATIILLPLAAKCLFMLGHQYVGLGALALSFLLFLYGLIATTGRLFLERLSAVTELKETIAALSEAREETERVAMTDGLTGIANRRAFMARLNALNGGPSAESKYGLLYIDLDRFKSVNDGLGHGIGDELLKTVVARIGASIRQGDLVARLGGDEFAVIAQNIGERAPASALAERLVLSLSEPYDLEGKTVEIGACVGVALAAESRVGGEVLLKQADLAMYAAKSAGRGAYCIFEPDMQRSAEDLRVLELGLRAALVNDGFELYYQPIHHLETGLIAGFECQVRWRHPLRGLLTPAQFLATAVDIGIAEDIGNWVITEACRQVSRWPSDVAVGINLSLLQIPSGNIALSVEKALELTGLPARRLELEFEVTESNLMRTDPETIESLQRIKDAGVSIALDDFGTGYSSLSYLVKFPFNRIKIDKSFVSQLGRSAQSDLIVCSIAQIAHKLNCSIVAEGIETAEQLTRVRALDIQYGQGTLLGAPLSKDEAAVLLARQMPAPGFVVNA